MTQKWPFAVATITRSRGRPNHTPCSLTLIPPPPLPPQDGRLHSGDHILRIGDTDLQGMGSDQVAQVLRQCGNRVRLVVTRGPADDGAPATPAAPLPTVAEQQVGPRCTGGGVREGEVATPPLSERGLSPRQRGETLKA